jgi:penicillin-binding protein 2
VSRYQSIYATHQKAPARWPWVLVVLIVIVLSAGTGAMIAQGETPRSLFDRVESGPPNSGGNPEFALAPEATSTVAAQEPTAKADSAPTSASAKPTGTNEPAGTDQSPETVSAASPSPGSELAVTDPTSPTDVVETYGERWGAGDFGGLYDLLTTDAKSKITRQDFIDRYNAIVAEAGLNSVKLTVTGDFDLDTSVPVKIDYVSSKVGKISEDNKIQLAKEGDDWKIAWTPSLIFTSLNDGCVDFTADTIRRGSILDRNGEPLAYDGTSNVIGIIPGQIEDESAMLTSLSKLVGLSTKEIKAKYADGQPEWFIPIKTFPGEIDQSVMSGISQLKGVAVRTETARIYPLGAKAAHITGYVTKVTAEDLAADPEGELYDDEWIGRAGLEAGANDILAGVPGGKLSIVDCDTRAVHETIAERKTVEPRDIVLTIDKDFQIKVDDILGDVKGSAVIIDPRNGAILALASHPSFDPNWFVLGFTDKDWAFVNDETQSPLIDRALQASYPTGSIFKVITMAAGLHDLGYTGDTEIDCPQQWSIPGTDQVWKDWTAEEGVGAQGMLTLHWALVNSCDTVFYQVGAALDDKDNELLPDMAKAFGLGSPTGIPYLTEIAGTVPDPAWKQQVIGDYWATGDAVNMAIGQGFVEATPLQMANAYAAIANNGSLLRPFIVEYTKTGDGALKRVAKRKVIQKLPLDKGELAEIQSALRDQTSNANGAGSYRVFGDFQWPIAGKTGTAENELNTQGLPHSWFAAYGPYGEKATIASVVLVESSGEGVSFAAPRTRKIYEAYIKTDLADVSAKS